MWKDIENPCYYLLVEPTVVWWVHLVELGQDGPDGFVGEVVHQLLQAKKKRDSTIHTQEKSFIGNKRFYYLGIITRA
jgi:hypothetical protein